MLCMSMEGFGSHPDCPNSWVSASFHSESDDHWQNITITNPSRNIHWTNEWLTTDLLSCYRCYQGYQDIRPTWVSAAWEPKCNARLAFIHFWFYNLNVRLLSMCIMEAAIVTDQNHGFRPHFILNWRSAFKCRISMPVHWRIDVWCFVSRAQIQFVGI